MWSPTRRAFPRRCWNTPATACTRRTARRPTPVSISATAAASRCSTSAIRSATTTASPRYRRWWWPACCSSRTVTCSTPTSRSRTRRWTGRASSRRPGASWPAGLPIPTRPAAAPWPPRSRSTATPRKGARPTRRKSCGRCSRPVCAPTAKGVKPCRCAGRSSTTTSTTCRSPRRAVMARCMASATACGCGSAPTLPAATGHCAATRMPAWPSAAWPCARCWR
ncbi:hypothetical protein D3C78_1146230 [compost metagenome]